MNRRLMIIVVALLLAIGAAAFTLYRAVAQVFGLPSTSTKIPADKRGF